MGIGEKFSGKGLHLIVNNIGQNEIPISGFRVEVANVLGIYRSIEGVAQRDTHTSVLQAESFNDKMCAGVMTTMHAYDHSSTYSPGLYNFELRMDFMGRKPSELSFSRGYFDKDKVKTILNALEQEGYADIDLYDVEGVQTVKFVNNAREYNLRLGFANESSQRRWIEGQIEKEKKEGRTGYYQAHPEELENLVNDRLVLRSDYSSYPKGLSLEGILNFNRNIHDFASTCEDVVKLVYRSHSIPEPDKTISLGVGS